MVFSDPGTTEGAGKLGVVLTIHQVVLQGLVKVAVGIGVSKLVPGQKRKNYSNKTTATSIVTVMGKLASL